MLLLLGWNSTLGRGSVWKVCCDFERIVPFYRFASWQAMAGAGAGAGAKASERASTGLLQWKDLIQWKELALGCC